MHIIDKLNGFLETNQFPVLITPKLVEDYKSIQIPEFIENNFSKAVAIKKNLTTGTYCYGFLKMDPNNLFSTLSIYKPELPTTTNLLFRTIISYLVFYDENELLSPSHESYYFRSVVIEKSNSEVSAVRDSIFTLLNDCVGEEYNRQSLIDCLDYFDGGQYTSTFIESFDLSFSGEPPKIYLQSSAVGNSTYHKLIFYNLCEDYGVIKTEENVQELVDFVNKIESILTDPEISVTFELPQVETWENVEKLSFSFSLFNSQRDSTSYLKIFEKFKEIGLIQNLLVNDLIQWSSSTERRIISLDMTLKNVDEKIQIESGIRYGYLEQI